MPLGRDRFYRNPDPMAALQETLFGAPSAPFIPTAGTSTDEQSILERPDIQQLMAAMFPQPEAEKHPLMNSIGARLGDALSAYAAGMGAGQPTNHLEQLRARREQQKGLPRERAQAELGLRLKDIEAKRQEKRQTQETELDKLAKDEDRKFQGDQNRLQRETSLTVSREGRETREEIAAGRRSTDEKVANIRAEGRGSEDALRDRIRKLEEPDEVEKRQLGKEKRETIKGLLTKIAAVADNLDSELTQRSPQQIREKLDDLLQIERLTPEEKKEVAAFYQKRLARRLDEAEMKARGF